MPEPMTIAFASAIGLLLLERVGRYTYRYIINSQCHKTKSGDITLGISMSSSKDSLTRS